MPITALLQTASRSDPLPPLGVTNRSRRDHLPQSAARRAAYYLAQSSTWESVPYLALTALLRASASLGDNTWENRSSVARATVEEKLDAHADGEISLQCHAIRAAKEESCSMLAW